MGCLPTSAFLYSLLARHDNFNEALIRIRVGTQKRESRRKYQTLLSLTLFLCIGILYENNSLEHKASSIGRQNKCDSKLATKREVS